MVHPKFVSQFVLYINSLQSIAYSPGRLIKHQGACSRSTSTVVILYEQAYTKHLITLQARLFLNLIIILFTSVNSKISQHP